MRVLKFFILCFSFTFAMNANADACGADMGRKFDEYGRITFKLEKERLNNLAEQLKIEPNAKAYIIVYAGRPSRVEVARQRGRRAIDYLVNHYGTNPIQIIAAALDTELYDKFTVELWIWPMDAPDDLPKHRTPLLRSRDVLIITGVEVNKRKKPIVALRESWPSHSHRGFSPVDRHASNLGNRLNGFQCLRNCGHRGKATVRMRPRKFWGPISRIARLRFDVRMREQ